MRRIVRRLSQSIIAAFLLGTAITVSAAHPPFPWQILPGEDIAETARLIYPKDAMARENLIRAIIRINPDHFPLGVNRQLAAGTVIQFPDLRTIGAYAKKNAAKEALINSGSGMKHEAHGSQQPRHINKIGEGASTAQRRDSLVQPVNQRFPKQPKRNPTIDSKQLKLTESIAQLEKTVLGESQQLAALTQQIAALESLLSEWHPSLPAVSALVTEDRAPQLPDGKTKSDSDHPVPVADAIDLPVETQLPEGMLVLVGMLFALLAGLVILRNFQAIKRRFYRQSLSADGSAQRETLLVLQRENVDAEVMRFSEPAGQVMAEVNALIEQNNSAAAIELLQKQLVVNRNDIDGWLQLFELLYQTGNKRDFKKNARRFKRMKAFPDIWLQIQELGSRLEPNESLYFNERQRQEKFFPESIDFP